MTEVLLPFKVGPPKDQKAIENSVPAAGGWAPNGRAVELLLYSMPLPNLPSTHFGLPWCFMLAMSLPMGLESLAVVPEPSSKFQYAIRSFRRVYGHESLVVAEAATELVPPAVLAAPAAMEILTDPSAAGSSLKV